jgi:hypothetical protein
MAGSMASGQVFPNTLTAAQKYFLSILGALFLTGAYCYKT